jgi:hypothetical protein
MPLNSDLREFLALLNSHQVEFLIVGAYAVAFHGYPRYTGDLDILVCPDAENARRVLEALTHFGFGGMGIRLDDLEVPGKVVQLGVSPNRIDLVTSITGVSFEEAWASREPADLDGVAVFFIGRTPLIRNKESTGRAKDLGDAEELRRRERKG